MVIEFMCVVFVTVWGKLNIWIEHPRNWTDWVQDMQDMQDPRNHVNKVTWFIFPDIHPSFLHLPNFEGQTDCANYAWVVVAVYILH